MSESSATPPATNESEAREVEAREVEAREVDPAVGESAVGESRPGGAGVVAALALILLGLTLWSAYQLMSYADNTALATTQAALVLPQIVAVTLIAGAAAGVLTVGWLGVRLGDGRSWVPRAAAGAIGGLVVGLLSMGGVLAAYHHGSSVAAVAITTAITGVAGGALAAVRPTAAITAGLAGAVAVSAFGVFKGYFEDDLVTLFGNRNTIGTMAEASYRLQWATSIVGGFVAGIISFVFLRRTGLALPWPAYLLAGGAPGALLLLSAAIAWLGGAPLSSAVDAASGFDGQVVTFMLSAFLNQAMVVFFVGAFVAMIAVGRTIRRTATETPG